MAISAHKLATKNLKKNQLLWAIFTQLALVTIVTQSEIAWLFITASHLHEHVLVIDDLHPRRPKA
ncbi:hypothetical protein [Chromobacterium vaccinii]|uniref:hypothetical protein n=1 Tax=Chromobacterium vaccinii TaxID=1108595 RepID=UPI000617D68E|nr:hypothetical protein [Chromobacterium vaccinii]